MKTKYEMWKQACNKWQNAVFFFMNYRDIELTAYEYFDGCLAGRCGFCDYYGGDCGWCPLGSRNLGACEGNSLLKHVAFWMLKRACINKEIGSCIFLSKKILRAIQNSKFYLIR